MKRVVLIEIEGTEDECQEAVDDLMHATDQMDSSGFTITHSVPYLLTNVIKLGGRSTQT